MKEKTPPPTGNKALTEMIEMHPKGMQLLANLPPEELENILSNHQGNKQKSQAKVLREDY